MYVDGGVDGGGGGREISSIYLYASHFLSIFFFYFAKFISFFIPYNSINVSLTSCTFLIPEIHVYDYQN